MHTILRVVCGIVLGIFLVPLSAHALGVAAEESVTLAADEIIDDNYFAAGNSVTIDGTVNGDVYAFGTVITINGTIGGDLISGGTRIEINGEVKGNLRAGATTIQINAPIGKNVTVAGATIALNSDSSVGWSFIGAGQTIKFDGPIGGNVNVAGDSITVNAPIGGNTDVTIGEQGHVALGEKARLDGDLTYRGTKAAQISADAVIRGATVHRELNANINFDKSFFTRAWIFLKLVSLFGTLLVGTILVSVAGAWTEEQTKKMLEKPGLQCMWGLIILIVVPIAVVILMLTLIGIPLGVVVLGMYFLALYLAKIFVGIIIGNYILRQNEAKPFPLIWRMMLGTTVVVLIVNIPVIGWLCSLGVTIWFLGSLWTRSVHHSSITPPSHAKH